MEPFVSIVIVNYNSSDHTIECIKSLLNVNYKNFEIIVVDNASSFKEREKLNRISEYVQIIYSEQNLGFAGGNNLAIEKILKYNDDYIMLLNEDTIVEPDIINKMIMPFQSDSSIGLVSPQIFYYYNRSEVQNAGGYINFWLGNTKSYYLNEYTGKGFYITFAAGCCILIKCKILKETGLLSEDYFLYYEDTDFSVKVLKNNYKIWFEPMAKVYHKGGGATTLWSPTFQYYITRGRFMFIKKNIHFPQKTTAYIYSFLFLIKAVITKKGQWKYMAKGFSDFLNNKKGKVVIEK